MALDPDVGGPSRRASTAAAAAPAAAAPAGAEEEACCVAVAVHIRPLIDIEVTQGCQEILHVTPGQPQVTAGPHTFTYDHVFGEAASDPAGLYSKCVQPFVEALFKGYNATVFAYGQTGSGKTHTMGSAFSPGGTTMGVIPNVMTELYARAGAAKDVDCVVRVSFVEIHKEEVRDLLVVDQRAPRAPVTIRELPTGVSLAGAVEQEVHNREEMAAVLERGSLCRATASTNMNNRSSRSHAIFTITLEQRRHPASTTNTATPSAATDTTNGAAGSDADEDEEAEEAEDGCLDDYLIAKMHLVDLAGSERAKRTGAEGARLKEAININKGLLALAKVISALVDGNPHVPYRDSKLTRLLQDSLGGNARTLMIACVSPADINREETINTLRYADRARHIRNRPVVNRDPVAAQLAQLRQQIAQLRAENTALRRALGADPAAVLAAAAGNGGGGEAYEELQLTAQSLESDNVRLGAHLDAAKAQVAELQERLLASESQKDLYLLKLQAARRAAAAAARTAAAAASEAAQTATTDQQQHAQSQPDAMTPVASAGPGGSDSHDAANDHAPNTQPHAGLASIARSEGTADTAGDTEQHSHAEATSATDQPTEAGGHYIPTPGEPLPLSPTLNIHSSMKHDLLDGDGDEDLDVIMGLRRRIAELEGEVKQVRSLQRMTSSFVARRTTRGGVGASTAGAFGASGAAGGGGEGGDEEGGEERRRPVRRSLGPHTPDGAAGYEDTELGLEEDDAGDVAGDAEFMAQVAQHVWEQEQMKLRCGLLERQLRAKEQRLAALQASAMQAAKGAAAGRGQGEGSAADVGLDLKAQYDRVLVGLQTERDALQKERVALVQKLQAVQAHSAEERRRMETAYRERLAAVERRVKQLGDKERTYQRSVQQLSRVESVCSQLQSEITRMRHQKASVARRMEAKDKEFRAWRCQREREVLQLRRTAQRNVARLQQHEAMAAKHQAVLKRKTEEADAARKRVRELLEMQSRNRQGRAEDGARMELQPNAAAPLLRTERARRDWLEQELDLCNQSYEYQRMLEGEIAQRAETARLLREVQKRMMVAEQLVPSSPLVSAAQLGVPITPAGGCTEEALLAKKARLQECMARHNAQIQELQATMERTRAEEEGRGGGAADVRRWTGIRNIVEARELLRTLFKCATDHKAQLNESTMDMAKMSEEMDLVRIQLDMAVQQAAAAKRHAAAMEATAATAIATPCHVQPDPLLDTRDHTDIEADQILSHLGHLGKALIVPPRGAGLASGGDGSRVQAGRRTGNSKAAASPRGGGPYSNNGAASPRAPYAGGPVASPSPREAFTGGGAASPRAAKAGAAAAAAAADSSRVFSAAALRSGSGNFNGNSSLRSGGGGGSFSANSSPRMLHRGAAEEGRPHGRGSRGGMAASVDLSRQQEALAALQLQWRHQEDVRRSVGGGTASPRAASARSAGNSPRLLQNITNGDGGNGRGRGREGSAGGAGLMKQQEELAALQQQWRQQQAARSSLSGAPGPLVVAAAAEGVAKALDFGAAQRPASAPVSATAAMAGAATAEEASTTDYEDAMEFDDDSDDGTDDADDDPDWSVDGESKKRSSPQRAWRRPRRPRSQQQGQQRQQGSRLSGGSLGSAGMPADLAPLHEQQQQQQLQQEEAGTSGSMVSSAPVSRAPSTDVGAAGMVSGQRSASMGSQVLQQEASISNAQRKGWERPVLEHLNSDFASEGRPAVNKLTVKLLKEALQGRVINGKPWKPGNKTKDQLISDYRDWLCLPKQDSVVPDDINNLTGSATWRAASFSGRSSGGGGALANESSYSYELEPPQPGGSSPHVSPREGGPEFVGVSPRGGVMGPPQRRSMRAGPMTSRNPARRPLSAGTSPTDSSSDHAAMQLLTAGAARIQRGDSMGQPQRHADHSSYHNSRRLHTAPSSPDHTGDGLGHNAGSGGRGSSAGGGGGGAKWQQGNEPSNLRWAAFGSSSMRLPSSWNGVGLLSASYDGSVSAKASLLASSSSEQALADGRAQAGGGVRGKGQPGWR